MLPIFVYACNICVMHLTCTYVWSRDLPRVFIFVKKNILGQPSHHKIQDSAHHIRSATPETCTAIKEKKRKRTKGQILETAVAKLMHTVTESWKESNQMSVQLDKRMKNEQEQKREERKLQLQMMQMLVGSSQPHHTRADHNVQFCPTFPHYGDQYFNPHGDTADS